jgi:hypothetical protein
MLADREQPPSVYLNRTQLSLSLSETTARRALGPITLDAGEVAVPAG